ncbi:MAG: alkaline phosphatase family protein [Muribaculaceae bacterium]|nr:alkaline phosphatase family protein [Muribaculaceae bacterium]
MIFPVLVWLCLCAMAQSRDNYTIIVSLDAMRWDYAEICDCPFFSFMAQNGVKATMKPSFPSKTYPTHYTMATGLVPDHHGIVSNSFIVPETGERYAIGNKVAEKGELYGGEPIWLTAKRQGVISATTYWVGSDVAIGGEYANYWRHYRDPKGLLTYDERVAETERLLRLPDAERPHFIMMYFDEPDHTSHGAGPVSMPTRRVVQRLDSILNVMWNRLQKLPIADKINLIVTGDHGMSYIDYDRTIPVKKYIKDEWVKAIEGDLPGLIYVTKPEYADSIVNAYKDVPHVQVFKREDVPARYNYGTNPRLGEVIAIPDLGWLFTDRPIKQGGTHGFDADMSDMHIMFRAIGPAFKKGYDKTTHFINTDLYPLLCHLLQVTPKPCDGTLDRVTDMLIGD